MESYGERTQTHTFENHANLLAYLANWPLYTSLLNAKAALSYALLKFSLRLLFEKLPERAPTKTQLRVLSIIDQLRAWAYRRSAYAQWSPLYPSLVPRPHPSRKRVWLQYDIPLDPVT